LDGLAVQYNEYVVNLDTLCAIRREEILRLAERRGAYNVRVFGSVARGEANENSDLDLLVAWEPGRSLLDHAGLVQDLQELLGTKVHVGTDSAPWNMVPLGGAGFGHAISKILSRPDLCDDLCANAIPWLAVVQGMMAAYFPNKPAVTSDQVH